jgi:hypothetical protein
MCEKKKLSPPLSISEVMHIGKVYDSVNGTCLSHHYGEILKIISKTSVDLCVCCGEYIPEGRMVCPQCEKKSQMG